jgi:hypothetical protein
VGRAFLTTESTEFTERSFFSVNSVLSVVKKRCFTLMEIAVACALIAIVVGLLMNSMRSSVLLAEEMGAMRRVVLERHKCYARLAQLFATASMESFKLEGRVLSFSCTNGIDLGMEFAGKVDAQLRLDEDKSLILVLSHKGKERVEHLFPAAQRIAFEKIGEEMVLFTITDKEMQEIAFPCFLTKEKR